MLRKSVFALFIAYSASTSAQQSKALQVSVDFKVWDASTGTFVKTDSPGYLFNPDSVPVLAIASFKGSPDALFKAECGSFHIQITTTTLDSGKRSAKLCPKTTMGTFNSAGRIFIPFDLGAADHFCNSTSKVDIRTPTGRKSFDFSVECGE